MGGTMSPPIIVSAAEMELDTAEGSVPAATFSFAAISWCARLTSPLPTTGSLRICSSCAWLYETVPSVSVVTAQAPGVFFQKPCPLVHATAQVPVTVIDGSLPTSEYGVVVASGGS